MGTATTQSLSLRERARAAVEEDRRQAEESQRAYWENRRRVLREALVRQLAAFEVPIQVSPEEVRDVTTERGGMHAEVTVDGIDFCTLYDIADEPRLHARRDARNVWIPLNNSLVHLGEIIG